MTQEIKIGVNANTSGAEAAVSKVETATERLAEALEKVDKAGKGAADSIRSVEQVAARLRNTQTILERELGRPVGHSDTEAFLRNFDRMRGGHGMGSRRLRDFDNFENWYLGHSSTFRSPGDAAAHRRRVLAAGMQGTDYAAQYGAPPTPPPTGSGPESGEGGGGGNFGQGVQKAQSMALAFGKSMLALAGLSSIAGMASSAVDMSTEENTGIDTLKRRAGDLGVSFDKLQDQVRGATDGLGVTYVESVRLAQQFAQTAGDLRRIDVGQEVHTGIGFSRAYGLDPAVGVQFFANMSRMKVGAGDAQGDRRLALMIGDAVNSGGYSAKADEIVSAVSDFAQNASRMTLSAPNVGGFASYLASLMGTGLPGLDPSGAAALLNTADASVRRGGGMGQAGLNFEYAALAGPGGGMDPVTAQGLMAGGLFGTTENTFGPGTALGKWYGSHGMRTPALSNVTNFEKIRKLMRSQYGNTPFYLDAMKNLLGLSSIEQASVLDQMSPTDLGASSRLLSAAGLDISKLSASGINGVAQIAGARGMGDLTAIYGTTMDRKDLSEQERTGLSDAFKSGDVEKLRQALVRVVGTHEQEKTEGSETRQSIADLKNELTRVGGLLLYPLNAIREGVTAMAMTMAPEEYKMRMQEKKDANVDFAARYRARGAGTKEVLDEAIGGITKAYERAKAAAGGKMPNVDDIAPRPSSYIETSTPGDFEVRMAQRQAVQAMIKRDFGVSTKDVPQDWIDMMGQTDKMLGLPPGTTAKQIGKESSFDPNAISPKGAMGLAQVMPDTLKKISKRFGRNLDPMDPMDALLIQREVMREDMAQFGNVPDALRAYNAGWDKSNWNNSETNNYVSSILGTPLPEGHTTKRGEEQARQMVLGFSGDATLNLKDQNGKPIGTAQIKPFVSGAPAGMQGPIPGVM